MRFPMYCCVLMLVGAAPTLAFGLDVDQAGAATARERRDVTPAMDKAAADKSPTVPKMQADTVAVLANAFAAPRIGRFRYQVTRLQYEVEPGSRLWSIDYELGPAPDGSKPEPSRFVVLLDDVSGSRRFADAPP